MADFVDSSITQEIIDAKNKLQVQAARAETIVNEWETTGNLVADAPQDNLTYGRRNGEWVEAGGGSGTGDMEKIVYDPQNIQKKVPGIREPGIYGTVRVWYGSGNTVTNHKRYNIYTSL